MTKRILVTGGAGFLGSHLCEKLVNQGHDVICLDNYFTGSKKNIEHLMDLKNFELIRHDITFPIFLEVNQIYNLACPASPIHYQYNAVKTIKTNVLGAIHVLGLDYYRMNNVDIRVVRIFNTYGPRMHPNDGRVVSNFIMQALKDDDITIYGTGEQTRSFCYVDDLLEGIIRLMNKEELIGPVNIGNPDEFTIKQLAELVIKLTGSKSKIVYRELPEDDPQQRQPDISLAKSELGWEPTIKLEEGLKKTIEYFKEI